MHHTNIFHYLAIKNALRQENLNPEIEEKLLNLQRCHEKQMKGSQRPTSVALANNHHEYTSPGKYSSASRKHTANRSMDDDDDWILETPKRRPPRTISSSEKRSVQNISAVESNVNRIIRSVAEETTPTRSTQQVITTPTKTNITPVQSIANKITKIPATSPEKVGIVPIKRDSEKKKHLQVRIETHW